MDQLLGFVEEGTQHHACRLKKSLYGLKQSPRAWYQRIDMFFTKEGFSRSHADHSLYVKQTRELLLIVIFYVDDLIILASDDAVLGWLKAKLEKEFEMSDIGPLEFCLGVAFERNRSARTITMSHLLPNSVGPVIVQATLSLATAVIDAAALSFLGLGGGLPQTAEWGRMLTYAQAELASSPSLAFLPGACIAITALGFTLLGESLREALDPKTRQK